MAPRRVHIGVPGKAKIADVFSIDAIQGGEALFIIGAAMGDPIGVIFARRQQHLRGDAAVARHFLARCQTKSAQREYRRSPKQLIHVLFSPRGAFELPLAMQSAYQIAACPWGVGAPITARRQGHLRKMIDV